MTAPLPPTDASDAGRTEPEVEVEGHGLFDLIAPTNYIGETEKNLVFEPNDEPLLAPRRPAGGSARTTRPTW